MDSLYCYMYPAISDHYLLTSDIIVMGEDIHATAIDFDEQREKTPIFIGCRNGTSGSTCSLRILNVSLAALAGERVVLSCLSVSLWPCSRVSDVYSPTLPVCEME